MNILVTLDRNYLHPLRVMLGSLYLNNPGEAFDVYLVGDGLTAEDLASLETLCAPHGALHPVAVPEDLFAGAPVVRYYSRAMYYRLLSAQLLPPTLDRVLYLDPDILVIGPVRPLYDTDLQGALMAASIHRGLTDISSRVNRLRLDTPEAEGYFNSGVLVMDLDAMRHRMAPEEIFTYAREHADVLILPDQDILNGLYGTELFPVDETLWNYDARRFDAYRLMSQGEKDMDWVVTHTAILHFCGKNKPWRKSYRGRFSALYKYIQRLLGEDRSQA